MVVEVKMGDPLWRAVGQKQVSLELGDGATVAMPWLDWDIYTLTLETRLKQGAPGWGYHLTSLSIANWSRQRPGRAQAEIGRHAVYLAPIVGGTVAGESFTP